MTIISQFGGARSLPSAITDRMDHLDALKEAIHQAYTDIAISPDQMDEYGLPPDSVRSFDQHLDACIETTTNGMSLSRNDLDTLILFTEKMGKCYSSLSLDSEGKEDQGYSPLYGTFAASLSQQVNYFMAERAKLAPIIITEQPTNSYI